MRSAAGTWFNSGNWWICLEGMPPGDPNRDLDDAVLYAEMAEGVPVHRSSWGQVKA